MENYRMLAPQSRGAFAERLSELHDIMARFLENEQAEGRTLQYAKVFMSDIQNQDADFRASRLYNSLLSGTALTVVEQPPLDASKITVLVKTADRQPEFIFHSLRLTPDETRGYNSYLQTMRLFEKYIECITAKGLDIRTHLVRTWIYVADIDVNYDGVVKARNDVFRQYGLTADTHYIASTGIGGYSATRPESVAIDFLTYPGITADNLYYLQALDHLNPTHEYGVAFERGTRLTTGGTQHFFISGTASIDNHGEVMHVGDVEGQVYRLLENIRALLADGGATMDDVRYFIVYLRDPSDHQLVSTLMQRLHPKVPHVIVHAKVCRPAWLVEMECVAVKEQQQ